MHNQSFATRTLRKLRCTRTSKDGNVETWKDISSGAHSFRVNYHSARAKRKKWIRRMKNRCQKWDCNKNVEENRNGKTYERKFQHKSDDELLAIPINYFQIQLVCRSSYWAGSDHRPQLSIHFSCGRCDEWSARRELSEGRERMRGREVKRSLQKV